MLSSLALVYNISEIEKYGYNKIGAVVSLSFRTINDSCYGECQ